MPTIPERVTFSPDLAPHSKARAHRDTETGPAMATILLVEDSPTEAYVIANILARHGYQTLTAATGEEGINMARNHEPDLILMDVVMPGLNGFQTTRKLAKDEQTAHIPVIVVSSKDQDTDRIWAIRQGARDYIVKPVKEDLLIDRVQTHLARI